MTTHETPEDASSAPLRPDAPSPGAPTEAGAPWAENGAPASTHPDVDEFVALHESVLRAEALIVEPSTFAETVDRLWKVTP